MTRLIFNNLSPLIRFWLGDLLLLSFAGFTGRFLLRFLVSIQIAIFRIAFAVFFSKKRLLNLLIQF